MIARTMASCPSTCAKVFRIRPRPQDTQRPLLQPRRQSWHGDKGEAVETQEELAYLKREGCTEAQGYLFSRLRPAAELMNAIRKMQHPVFKL